MWWDECLQCGLEYLLVDAGVSLQGKDEVPESPPKD